MQKCNIFSETLITSSFKSCFSESIVCVADKRNKSLEDLAEYSVGIEENAKAAFEAIKIGKILTIIDYSYGQQEEDLKAGRSISVCLKMMSLRIMTSFITT